MPEAAGSLVTEDVARPDALEGEWRDLVGRCAGATPFQRPEWLLPWTRCFRPHAPWVIAVRQAGRLVGLAPLFVYERGGERVLAPLGAGVTDHLDLPCEHPAALRAIFGHLDRARARWDVCDLEQLRPGSPVLQAPCPPGWTDEVVLQDACPLLELPAVAGPRQAVSASHLRKLRHYRRLAADVGPLRLELAGADRRAALLEALLRLHGARWRTRGLPGMLADPVVEEFHREVSAGMLACGALRLYGLHAGDALIAVLYGLAGGDRLYLYLSGFDPVFARLSPGLLLLGAILEHAVEQGFGYVDFLRGREPYKYTWGAQDVVNHRRSFRHGGPG